MRQAWLVVGLLWFVAALNYMARVMLTTMHGSIVAAIPMSEAQFGLLTSVFLWIYGLLSPLAGFISDRLGRRRVIVTSLLVWSAVTWLTAYARTFPELVVMRALMGVSECCYFPAALALITEYHPGPTQSRAVGLHMTGLWAGAALGGLGGWLAEVRGWSFAFSLVGGIGVLYGLVLVVLLRDAPAHAKAIAAATGPAPEIRLSGALSSLLGSGPFWLVLSFCAIQGAVGYAVVGWMPTYLQEHFHLRQGVAGLSATGYRYLAELAGVAISGFWADRWSRSQVRAPIFVLAIGVSVAVPGVFLAGTSGLVLFAILGLMLWGLASGFADCNLMPVICLTTDRRYRATAYGASNLASAVAGGLAVYGSGLWRDRHFDFGRILVLASVILLLCPALLLWTRTRPARGQASA